ncbi:hypothetical protein LTSEJOH_0548, partial [Salmonella enterica subsp. enterica serovar Johannesburg str. S5-703]
MELRVSEYGRDIRALRPPLPGQPCRGRILTM